MRKEHFLIGRINLENPKNLKGKVQERKK